MDIEHLDAVTILAALNYRVLSAPGTGQHVRAAIAQLDEGLEALQDAYAGDLFELDQDIVGVEPTRSRHATRGLRPPFRVLPLRGFHRLLSMLVGKSFEMRIRTRPVSIGTSQEVATGRPGLL